MEGSMRRIAVALVLFATACGGAQKGSTTEGKTGAAPEAEPKVTGGIPKDEIRQIIRSKLPQIEYCYQQALGRNPMLEGTSHLTFTITAQGNVIDARAQGLDADVDACIVEVVRELDFPEPSDGQPVTVTDYPFTFQRR
jgi:hypothetical protein